MRSDNGERKLKYTGHQEWEGQRKSDCKNGEEILETARKIQPEYMISSYSIIMKGSVIKAGA